MISDQAYMEMMKNCSKWNSKMMGSRKKFVFDQQTGIVHRPSDHLFRQPYERKPGANPLQVYTYPPKRWVKPKSHCSDAVEQSLILRANPAIADAANSLLNQGQQQPGVGDNTEQSLFSLGAGGTQGGSGPQTRGNTFSFPKQEPRQEGVGGEEYEFYEDSQDQLEPTTPPDEDDWSSSKKRGKGGAKRGGTDRGGSSTRTGKKSGGAGGATGGTNSSRGVPKEGGGQTKDSFGTGSGNGTPVGATEARTFACTQCGARYKSRPGLTYHKIHVHGGNGGNGGGITSGSGGGTGNGATAGGETPSKNNQSPIISPRVIVSPYCDFCLNGREANANGEPEELVSCHDCGRSGHPTCLKFTPNMLVSTRRHGWQCIECKSCAICGTSENDDKLLFCDDCDRGFHLYCLTPPLSSPPESDWSCYLCIKAFGMLASINKIPSGTSSAITAETGGGSIAQVMEQPPPLTPMLPTAVISMPQQQLPNQPQ